MTKDLHELVKEKQKKLRSFGVNDLSESLLTKKDGEIRHHELGYQEGLADGVNMFDEFFKEAQESAVLVKCEHQEPCDCEYIHFKAIPIRKEKEK